MRPDTWQFQPHVNSYFTCFTQRLTWFSSIVRLSFNLNTHPVCPLLVQISCSPQYRLQWASLSPLVSLLIANKVKQNSFTHTHFLHTDVRLTSTAVCALCCDWLLERCCQVSVNKFDPPASSYVCVYLFWEFLLGVFWCSPTPSKPSLPVQSVSHTHT